MTLPTALEWGVTAAKTIGKRAKYVLGYIISLENHFWQMASDYPELQKDLPCVDPRILVVCGFWHSINLHSFNISCFFFWILAALFVGVLTRSIKDILALRFLHDLLCAARLLFDVVSREIYNKFGKAQR